MNGNFSSPGSGTKDGKLLSIPATPNLKRLGYGTGVGVFHVERSPKNGQYSSPWALKKLMRKENNNTAAERLRSEAAILKTLNHPNIIGFRAFSYTADGRECLAMEECQVSLSDLIDQRYDEIGQPFPPTKIFKIANEIAKALDYLHNTVLLLHGDIKSANILIKGDFETVKLCDFGVSLPLKTDGYLDTETAGKNASYVGTSLWCAPEVYFENDDYVITDKADIFSYGLTLWEMLSLAPPHMDAVDESLTTDDSSIIVDKFEELLDSEIGTRPKIPDTVNQMDPEYKNIISLFEKCTEENFTLRFSIKQVLDFLNNI